MYGVGPKASIRAWCNLIRDIALTPYRQPQEEHLNDLQVKVPPQDQNILIRRKPEEGCYHVDFRCDST
jgi:hypothetical protein